MGLDLQQFVHFIFLSFSPFLKLSGRSSPRGTECYEDWIQNNVELSGALFFVRKR